MFNKYTWEKISELIPIGSYPKLPCPYCNSDTLEIDESSLLVRKLSGVALSSYIDKFKSSDLVSVTKDDHAFMKVIAVLGAIADSTMHDPSQFLAFFKCSMCNENVSSIGIAKVPKSDTSGIIQIKVENFNPPIPMFQLNSVTPKSINEELISSFSHFHADTCSSGNRLRRAMEKLCKELGCYQGNLHRSIQALSKEYPQEAKWLEPLKLVGNEATHADGVTESDLLDSFHVFEVVLDIFRRREIEASVNSTVARLENKFKNITKQSR
ncbi:DUF4145 domain-containing protein [Photobacterium sanguinicancri]|uniref:DUF4145 domain-containing protein n=1 Tax=Photobacterium sanguinicancri TaxID=875932 RepID=UPI0026E3218C|nr:DUF4145 domain-containing protein [Photobacterium sanguinicancri]MDO6501207.1 DUF4145 domain-containing protein [Photobacterium sanguinicancri]